MHPGRAQALVEEQDGAGVKLNVRAVKAGAVWVKLPPLSMLQASGPPPACCSMVRVAGLIAVISDSSSVRWLTGHSG